MSFVSVKIIKKKLQKGKKHPSNLFTASIPEPNIVKHK